MSGSGVIGAIGGAIGNIIGAGVQGTLNYEGNRQLAVQQQGYNLQNMGIQQNYAKQNAAQQQGWTEQNMATQNEYNKAMAAQQQAYNKELNQISYNQSIQNALNEYSYKLASMRAAGVNPLVGMGDGGGSAALPNMGNGGSGSGGAPEGAKTDTPGVPGVGLQHVSFDGIASSIANAANAYKNYLDMEQQDNNINKTMSETELNEMQKRLAQSQVYLNKQDIKESIARMQDIYMNIEKSGQELKNMSANERKTLNDAYLQEAGPLAKIIGIDGFKGLVDTFGDNTKKIASGIAALGMAVPQIRYIKAGLKIMKNIKKFSAMKIAKNIKKSDVKNTKKSESDAMKEARKIFK